MPALTPRRFILSISICLGLALLAILLSPGFGTSELGLIDAWQSLIENRNATDAASSDYNIAFRLRLARAVKALLAGITLALCGAVFQTLFRNPLATPYTLGIANGGSLGALIAIQLGLSSQGLFLSATTLCAFVGSITVVGCLTLLARLARNLSSNTILLGGVTLGYFCSALMMLVMYLANEHDAVKMLRWMMGSLDTVGHRHTLALLPFLVIVWFVLLMRSNALNQYELGPEIAATRGVNPTRLLSLGLVVGSLATAAIVSVCGPIGFVGLIVPHAARRLFGPDHRLLLPTSGLLGGTFLIVCDWMTARTPVVYGLLVGQEFAGTYLPIGFMTALIGAPLFLILLGRRLR